MNYGVKISLPGNDVTSADPEECAVTTQYPSPKIKVNASPAHFATVDYTFSGDPGAGNTTITTVAHGYSGYVPMAMVYVKDFQSTPNPFYVLPATLVPDTGNGVQALRYYTDGTNLVIYYRSENNGFGDHVSFDTFRFIFKYYIFAEPGA